MKDKYDILRGACNNCNCTEYGFAEGTAKCEDCGCPSSKHREEVYGKSFCFENL